jgi:hypothetical protein
VKPMVSRTALCVSFLLFFCCATSAFLIDEKCSSALDALAENGPYQSALKAFKGENSKISIEQECPCINSLECECDLKKKWKGVPSFTKACEKAGGKLCFTNEFYRKEQLDVSLYHINPICVPSDVCANEDLAVIGQDFTNGKCAEDACYIVLTCTASSKPIVVTDHLGGMVSHASTLFFRWIIIVGISGGVLVCVYVLLKFACQYQKQRDMSWAFDDVASKAPKDAGSTTVGEDENKLRQRKKLVEMSVLKAKGGDTGEEAVEIDLDEIGENRNKHVGATLKCV